MRSALCATIRVYQIFISPWLGSNCRFYPSCSELARQAVASHGVLKGSWIAIRRLLSCHPFHPGGYDPLE